MKRNVIFKRLNECVYINGFIFNRFDRRRFNKIRKAFVGRTITSYNTINEQYDELKIVRIHPYSYDKIDHCYSYIFTLSNYGKAFISLDEVTYNNLNHIDSKQLDITTFVDNDNYKNYITVKDLGDMCLSTI